MLLPRPQPTHPAGNPDVKTIQVDYLARVEGEGALKIHFDGEQATSVELRIFEPPRFFEGFLQGRSALETPDITARICGICPVAYQMSACHAVENALGLVLPDELRKLRRLLYCGEWIESHVLHMFMLHLPDFLGMQSSLEVAKTHGDEVRAGLRIKKAGNAIVNLIGGREIHPINVKVGGFYRSPSSSDLQALLPELRWSKQTLLETLEWFATLDFPDFERDYEFVALRHETDYPFCEGRLVSNKGLDIDISEYDQHFEEQHLAHSTALHSVLRARGAYFCGPLARFNLNFDKLCPDAAQAARAINLTPPCTNPFKSLLVRTIEAIQVFDEAITTIESYTEPKQPAIDVPLKRGVGFGCTEAPRGILYHRYAFDEAGTIEQARIVPPTSQNQKTIEEDLLALSPQLVTREHEAATWLAEQAVRNYDPCISCSTHFLKLQIERT
jgi:coenzyme F420-reducing hydrogenase alpha subunit